MFKFWRSIIKFTIFLFIFSVSLKTFAQVSSLFNGATEESESKKEQSLEIPRVESLAPKWFEYLIVSDKELLSKNHSKFKDYLKEVYEDLPREAKRIVLRDLENIFKNLNYLKQNSKDLEKDLSTPRIHHKNYQIREYVELLKLEREKSYKVKEDRIDIDNLTTTINTEKQRYDDIYASYLKYGNNDPKKIISSFKIISKKLSILIEENDFRFKKNLELKLQKKLKEIQSEIDVAIKNLRPSKEDTEWINQELKTALDNLVEFSANAKQNEIENGAQNIKPYSLLSIVEKTKETYLSLVYHNRKLIQGLISLKEGVTPENLSEIKNLLSFWQKKSNEITEQLQIWDKIAIREFNKETSAKLVAKDIGNNRLKELQETFSLLQEIENEIKLGKILLLNNANLVQNIDGIFQSNWGIIVEVVMDYASKIGGVFSSSLFTISGTPFTLFGIIRVIFIIFISFLISSTVREGLVRLGEKKTEFNPSSLYILGRLSHYVILTVGLVVGLSSIGIDFSSLAIVAGALTVGIGFGLQSIFNNFVSGLILLFERPLKVGDYIELASGTRGEVKEINVRSTRITTRDNIDILVPNHEFISGRIINWTLYDTHRRIHVQFGVSYGTDKELVKKAALEAASKVNYTISGNPKYKQEVWLTKFGDSSLDFELIVWINHKLCKKDRVEVDYLWELDTAFKKYNIEIPFPQRDIHLKSVLGKTNANEAPNISEIL